MINNIFQILSVSVFIATLTFGRDFNTTEIDSWHYHTYFLQNNAFVTQEALELRTAIQQKIDEGVLAECRLNIVNYGPRGPHPIGSFETCCNKTSIPAALSFFMQNHGNLSILLHPLTRFEVKDHTERSMFLGPRLPLDISILSNDLGDNLDHCLPLISQKSQTKLIDTKLDLLNTQAQNKSSDVKVRQKNEIPKD